MKAEAEAVTIGDENTCGGGSGGDGSVGDEDNGGDSNGVCIDKNNQQSTKSGGGHGSENDDGGCVDCSKGALAISVVQKVVLSFNGCWGKRSE
jgi:hypothetical protein